MCTKLSIRCQNPTCQQPLTATPRYSPYNNDIQFYACDPCIAIKHGPHETPYLCRDCRQDERGCICYEKIEFLYGGPLVICPQCLKQTVWLKSITGTGFAGGQIYLDTFSCGHNIMDESADMAAAY